MTGYFDFDFIVEFGPSKADTEHFVQCRRWCVAQFGDSVEYPIWEDFLEFRNLQWSWEREKYNGILRCRLYLDEQSTTLFTLKWS